MNSKKYKENKLFVYLRKIFLEIREYEIYDTAAQIAFFLMLSFFPFLFLLISLLTFIPMNFGNIIEIVTNNIPNYLNFLLDNNNYLITKDTSTLQYLFSLFLTIFSASSATSIFIIKINKIYNIKLVKYRFVYRLLSIFVNFVFIAIIFSFSMFFLVLRLIINNFFTSFGYLNIILVNLIILLTLFLFFYIMILMLYYFSTPKRFKLKDIYIGAFIVTIFLIISLYALDLYFSTFNPFTYYGVIGGVIILLIYFYVIANVVLLGGIINKTIYINPE